MSFQDKYNEYKQRKEAQAFFNQNNNEKIHGKDYLIALVVGTGASIVLGFIMEMVIAKTGFNLSYFSILVGILQAMAIKKVLNKSGNRLAGVSVLTYLLGLMIAQTLYISITLPFFSMQIFIDMFIMNLKYLVIGDLFGTIIYLFGAVASYMSLRD